MENETESDLSIRLKLSFKIAFKKQLIRMIQDQNKMFENRLKENKREIRLIKMEIEEMNE